MSYDVPRAIFTTQRKLINGERDGGEIRTDIDVTSLQLFNPSISNQQSVIRNHRSRI